MLSFSTTLVAEPEHIAETNGGKSVAGRIELVGFGSPEPPPDELISSAQILEILAGNGVVITDAIKETLRAKIGIEYRWQSSCSTTELAIAAARLACKDAQLRDPQFSPQKIGVIFTGSSSPGRIYPSAACFVQKDLSISRDQVGGGEVSAACTSWVIALKAVRDALIADNLRYGLAVASETILSRVAALDTINDNMWGDGSGAVVVRHNPDGDPGSGLVYARSYLDGEHAHLIVSRGMGTDSLPGETPSPYLVDAPSVQRFAIQAIPAMILEGLEKMGIGRDRSIWLLPHNANLSMVNRIGERVGLTPDRILTTIVDRGNMSSASIPVTLAREVCKGTFNAGDVLIFAGFGAGMTVGIILYIWPG